jgi:DeoR/GlpR family transcriptional regulator of sugar metabolism
MIALRVTGRVVLSIAGGTTSWLVVRNMRNAKKVVVMTHLVDIAFQK